MNKKVYVQPDMQAVSISLHYHLLVDSPVNNVAGNASLNYKGGGSGPARGRGGDSWDDED